MTGTDDGERRQFSRIPFDARATLRGADGGTAVSTLLDISLKGALLERPQAWSGRAGDEATLEITLGGDAVTIRMEVTVAHVEADRIGLHCTHIDLDSIAHLRRLIELNLGDPELLNRELSALG